MTLQQLGSRRVLLPAAPVQQRTGRGAPHHRRLKILSKNLGGMRSTTHDTYMTWLTEQGQQYDIIMLQETHYGLGREFTEYTVPGWSIISSPDPKHRWTGVAIYVSHRISAPEDIRYNVIVPGRVLHVRIPTGRGNHQAHIDLINVYQWAWDADPQKQRLAKRQQIWTRLGRLLRDLPKRNVLCVGGDFNYNLNTQGAYVGSGTFVTDAGRSSSFPDVEEFAQVVESSQLCALNTWGNRARSYTFAEEHAKGRKSQIDFLLTHLEHADGKAKQCAPDRRINFSPWRQGAAGLLQKYASRSSAAGMRSRLSAVFAAFRKWQIFRRCQRELQQRGKERRKQRLEMSWQEAETAANVGDMHTLYSCVRKLAPKTARERIQIRSIEDKLLTPQQEFQHIQDYFAKLYSRDPKHQDTLRLLAPYNITAEILQSLSKLQSGRAVPKGKVPPEVWKLLKHDVVPVVGQLFRQCLQPGTLSLPPEWRDGWLRLLPKPNKPTKTPANLRPIALQCPLGKCLARVIKTRLLAAILPKLQQTAQYAYLPNRSTGNAIARVAQHCSAARARLGAIRREVFERRAGLSCAQASGAAMLSVDMSKAFDKVSRSYLVSALQFLGVDGDTITLILAIHEAQYHIEHQAHCGSIDLSNGIRQGCVLSPLLWVCVTTYMLHRLEARTCIDWVRQDVTAFADDFICAHNLYTIADATTMAQRIQCLFEVLQEAGMQVNADKSKFVYKIDGGPLRRWFDKRYSVKGHEHFLNMGKPFQPLLLRVDDRIDYLGVVMSYDNFEEQSLNKRLQAARANLARLSKHLFARRGLSLRHRVSLYRVCVRSAALYGLASVGLPDKGHQTLQRFEIKHIRAIAKSPGHITHEANAELYQRLECTPVVDALQAQLQNRCPDAPSMTAAEQEVQDFFACHLTPTGGERSSGSDTQLDKWSGWNSQKRGRPAWTEDWKGAEEEDDLCNHISGHQLREIVATLARLALHHEDTEAALRADTSFMLYLEEGAVNQSLRVTLIICMLTEMRTKMDMVLREVDAIKTPIPHEEVKQSITRIFELITVEGMLMKFHGTRPMAETYKSDVLPFVLMISNRGGLADELHSCLLKLCDCACLRLIGGRMRPDRMKRQPLANTLSTLAGTLMDRTNPYRRAKEQEKEQEAKEKAQAEAEERKEAEDDQELK
ncbi:unnamed protein product [Symbiodinium sp. CCMP2456]|nr:unnamed protein product [Symbiodinium sp. CCMP2456]